MDILQIDIILVGNQKGIKLKKLLLLLLIGLSLHANIMEEIERFNTVLKEAKEGDTLSQYWVAERYLNGKGTQQDLSKGVYWYEKSADKGYIKSIMSIGKIYIKAGKNEETVEKGVHYYETLSYYDEKFPNLCRESSDYQARYRIKAFQSLIELYGQGARHLKADKTKSIKYFKELQEFQTKYEFAKFLDTAGLYYPKKEDKQHQELLFTLIEAGCDVNAVYKKEKTESYSLFFYSIVKNNQKIFDTLLDKGVNINYTNEQGKNAFYIAIQTNNLAFAKKLYQKGIKLNYNASEKNPLTMAALLKNKKMTDYLVSIGYNPKHPIVPKKNLLDFVLYNGDETSIKYIEWILKKYNFNLNKKHNKRYYLHSVSMQQNMMKKIQLLLKYGADKTLEDTNGFTAKEFYEHQIEKNKILIKKYEGTKENKVKVMKSENQSIQRIIDNALGEEYYYIDAVVKKWNENLRNAVKILK